MATFWIEDNCLRAEGLVPGSIRDSIAKWETLRDLCLESFLGHDGGSETCALCQKYYDCIGCPIHQATGLFDCRGTPYVDYYLAVKWGDIATALSAAEEEIAFLESLLEV